MLRFGFGTKRCLQNFGALTFWKVFTRKTEEMKNNIKMGLKIICGGGRWMELSQGRLRTGFGLSGVEPSGSAAGMSVE
jgi:hypothetical protein